MAGATSKKSKAKGKVKKQGTLSAGQPKNEPLVAPVPASAEGLAHSTAPVPTQKCEHATFYVELCQLAVLLVGTIIGGLALKAYQGANTTAMESQLLTRDFAIIERAADKGGAVLFAVPPKEMKTGEDAKYFANEIVCQTAEQRVDWSGIEDLYEQFYSSKHLNDAHYDALRKAYGMAEMVMTHLASVSDFKHEGIISPGDADTWFNYVNDVGANPFFVMAVWRWHRVGYIADHFARDIRVKIKSNPKVRLMFQVYYPDVLDEGWSERIGDGSNSSADE